MVNIYPNFTDELLGMKGIYKNLIINSWTVFLNYQAFINLDFKE